MFYFLNKLSQKDYIRFLLTGMLNTLFGYVLYSFFIYLSLHYTIAVFFSTVLGVLFNYNSISKLVFPYQGSSRLFPFVIVYVLVFFLNVYGLWPLEVFGFDNKYIAGAMLLLPLALLSFLLNKFWVFKKL